MENELDDTWVRRRLDAAAPAWNPDPRRAWAHLTSARMQHPPRRNRLLLAAAATAFALLAIAVLPQGRALAQELWIRLLVTRVDVIRVDLSRLPLQTSITTNGLERFLADADAAAARAGFRPLLPPASVVPGPPAFSVTGTIQATQILRVADLRTALANAGVHDAPVPQEWEGATIRALIGPMLIADYPGNVEVLQLRPIELLTPSGLALDKVAETALRATGMPWWEARAFGRKFAANPGWLLHVPADEPAIVREITLRNGTGLLLEDIPEAGEAGRASVIYSGPDRILLVSSPDRETSIRIANALE